MVAPQLEAELKQALASRAIGEQVKAIRRQRAADGLRLEAAGFLERRRQGAGVRHPASHGAPAHGQAVTESRKTSPAVAEVPLFVR
jgi:hypothetical protein